MSKSTDRALSTILVTGGSGFIGSNFVRYLLSENTYSGRIINLDALTYAGNPENLSDIVINAGNRYRFVHGSVTDSALLDQIFSEEHVDTVVHFAAESHVDRSIHGPGAFVETNIVGTFALLEAARRAWGFGGAADSAPAREDVLFHHVSTDEVYGSLGADGYFTEKTAYDPRSPYSASKAASDHLVRAYHHTYGIPITLTNCSNNYGPYQFPEKLIPVMILNILEKKPLPVYGDGGNVRDWLYVEDHNRAVWTVMKQGKTGSSYNIGGDNEWKNLELVETLCDLMAEELHRDSSETRSLVTFVKDRPGHDRRYAIDCSRIKDELGWQQSVDFSQGLQNTVRWYLRNMSWVEGVRRGTYREWIERNYQGR